MGIICCYLPSLNIALFIKSLPVFFRNKLVLSRKGLTFPTLVNKSLLFDSLKASDTIFEWIPIQFQIPWSCIDLCLAWRDHIHHIIIVSKISSRISMRREARKAIPREACINLYNSMVLLLFDYCCNVWDPCGATEKIYLIDLKDTL